MRDSRLGELEHHLDAGVGGRQLARALGAEQQVEVLGRCQHDVGAADGGAEGGLGQCPIRPAAGAEIGVEGDAAAAGAGEVERLEQPLAPGLAIERQSYSREIDDIVLDQGRGEIGRLRQLEQQPRRRAVAPVVETPLPIPIGADDMEPRQPARHAHDEVRADALGAPGRQHLVAPGVVAQRGHVVDGDAEAGKVDGGVQRVAAIAARQQTGGCLRQLDHALSD